MRKETKINPPWPVKVAVYITVIIFIYIYYVIFSLFQPTPSESDGLLVLAIGVALVFTLIYFFLLKGLWNGNIRIYWIYLVLTFITNLNALINFILAMICITLLLFPSSRRYFGFMKKGGESNG